jgi:lipase
MPSESADGTPREGRIEVNGVELAYFEWPGAGRPVLFAHATGFHARCWDQVIAKLPGAHCFAVDLRGHGRSAKPPPPYIWHDMGVDLAELALSLGLRDAVGVGHSGGGYAVTLAAGLAQGSFARLLLVDPVISPRERYATTMPRTGASFVLKRKNDWTSPEEMFERFKDRPPYSLWQPAVLRDYCEFGLLPSPDGQGYVLACPPEVEAAVYAGAGEGDIYDVIHRLDMPVRVLRARQRRPAEPGAMIDMSASPTSPDIASHFPQGEDVFLPELSHYIPMEAPEVVAQHLRDMLK